MELTDEQREALSRTINRFDEWLEIPLASDIDILRPLIVVECGDEQTIYVDDDGFKYTYPIGMVCSQPKGHLSPHSNGATRWT